MTREELYINYIKEMGHLNLNIVLAPLMAQQRQGNKKPDLDQAIKDNYNFISSWYDITWFDIFDGMENVGFIIIATGDHCPIEYDYYILEAYIKPESRKRGLMINMLEAIFKNNPGTYGCYFMIQNKDALKFYKRISKKFKFKPAQIRTDSKAFEYNCIEKAFKIG